MGNYAMSRKALVRQLKAVLLFVAIGLLLTAAFLMLGFGVEFGRILTATG
jgi:hypothetical protein